MKDDVIGFSHKFETLYAIGITNENHHLSPGGKFILSNVFWNEDVGSHPNTRRYEMSGLCKFNALKGVHHARHRTGVLLYR